MRIKVCEFRARNITTNPMYTKEIEKENGKYYYITFDGYRSHEYRSLAEAKEDIKGMYKHWKDFKMLI